MSALGFGLAFLIVAQVAPTQKTGGPTTLPSNTIEVSARKLVIPSLPESVQAAHTQNSEVRPRVLATLKDLDKDLAILYASPEYSCPMPASIKVPAPQAEEVKFLSTMIQDTEHEKLLATVQAAWERWQRTFVETGLGEYRYANHKVKLDPNEMVAIHNTTGKQREIQEKITGRSLERFNTEVEMNTEPTEQEKEIARQLKDVGPAPSVLNRGVEPLNARTSAYEMDAEATWLAETCRKFKTYPMGIVKYEIDWDMVHTLKGELDWMQKRTALAVVARRVSNQEAPNFSKLWQPLAEHLNANAKRLLDYELAAAPNEKPELHALRVQAKVAFLERFRTSLWFGGMVQSYMTSQTPPEIPKELRTDYAQAQLQKNHN